MQSTTIQTTARARSISTSKASAVIAMMLGGFMIFIVGFSHIDVVHNAAHDTRHSSSFPCH